MNKDLVGLGAYLCLAGHGRLVKDAQLAPTVHDDLELLVIADRVWEAFGFLHEYAQRKDWDIEELLEPGHGSIDQLEGRLRPSDWWDRVTKTYVSVGAMADLWRILAEASGNGNIVTDELRGGFGHVEWAQTHILHAEDDATLAPRLSLWGRRVLGDVVTTLRASRNFYPQAWDNAPDDIVDQLTAHHMERMAAAGLKG